MHEKTLTSKTVFSGKLLRFEVQDVELENGQKAYRELIRHPGAVAVLARAPDGRFVFVRQFRKAVEKIMIEVIAGILEPGEQPQTAAHRELKEETGYDAEKLSHLGRVYPSPGYVDEAIDVYFADLAVGPGPKNPDWDECLEVVMMPAAEFEAMVRSGGVQDAKTLAAWAMYKVRG
ncbi:MAG: NUDIX hydrolase [bacterium]